MLSCIFAAERQLIEMYGSIGIYRESNAAELCCQLVSKNTRAADESIRVRLEDLLAALNADVEQLKQCIGLLQTTTASFENAKGAVIRNGSPTLIGELDSIKLGLDSDLLLGLLTRPPVGRRARDIEIDGRVSDNAAKDSRTSGKSGLGGCGIGHAAIGGRRPQGLERQFGNEG